MTVCNLAPSFGRSNHVGGGIRKTAEPGLRWRTVLGFKNSPKVGGEDFVREI